MSPRPVLIAGPTASGKSALALAIAERDGGTVINADASQVYDCWRVLSARPDAADLARAPHRLYGHVAATTRHSVGDWLREATAAIAEARHAGLRPIVVGGTGLCFQALTAGLAPIPPIPPEIDARSQALLDAGEIAALIAGLDPETRDRIDLRNPRRVQRAWNVLHATGRGLARWHADTGGGTVPDAERLLLWPEVESLDRRIAARFETMLAEGALDEVAAFVRSAPDWSLPSARVLGARPLADYLAGAISRAAATDAAVTATRQFAKRQRTWFRSRMADWPRFHLCS